MLLCFKAAGSSYYKLALHVRPVTGQNIFEKDSSFKRKGKHFKPIGKSACKMSRNHDPVQLCRVL